MPLGTDHVTNTTEDTFIPELWSDEVIATYKQALVIANRVKKIPFAGKKGDTLHVPKPVRGTANQKLAETQVTLNADVAGELVILVDQHFEYSRFFEDITLIQALDSMRAFYTDDAGYALAKQVDSALSALAEAWQGGTAWSGAVIGGDGETAWDPAANTNTGNGSDLTDAGIRSGIQVLDDADVPFSDRSMIVPPSQKNILLGIDRFNSRDFSNTMGVQTGQFGDVYGMPVFTTTNLPVILADDTTTEYRPVFIMHREAIVHVEQMSIRTQTQYKQEWLSDLLTSDTIYGKSVYRPENGIALIV
ncbi:MAG: hypothetical protein GY906_17355, partial [bacterium]|nr:hypothetical protein [bacterium]